jgi:transposase
MDTVVAYIGLDWADERHSVHLQPANGAIEHRELEQKPAVLHEWIAQLQQRFGGGKIAVALEQRKGAVIHALLMYDCFVLYPMNPKALARYREAFRTSGAKDDPLDSELLLDLVVRHRDQLRAWVPDTVESRTLQALCEQRRKLVNQRVALTNRLTSLLKQYFPQALEWVGDMASVQACDFLTQWPTLAVVQHARPGTIRQFYRAHNCRKAAVIEARLTAIGDARPLTTDAAVIEPLCLSVQTYATQLRTLIGAIQTFDERIAELFAAHGDHDVFTSFPGAGDVCAPRLAAAFGTDRARWDSAAELQAHSGIAPVTARSGKTVWVHHRLACSKFVKQTFHEFADQSIRFSRWARAYYDQQRARGNGHHAALRALAYKWLRILFRCWKERRAYDEDTYLDSLRRRGSPLAKHFA